MSSRHSNMSSRGTSPHKIIESVRKQSPRGGKKKRNVKKVRETSQNRKTVAYALISTVPIKVLTEPVCPSNFNIRTQGCAEPENQCHDT